MAAELTNLKRTRAAELTNGVAAPISLSNPITKKSKDNESCQRLRNQKENNKKPAGDDADNSTGKGATVNGVDNSKENSDPQKMGDRKWEDLPVDFLVDIFSRVGVVSLVYEVPYVCKSWHRATLSPLCWKSLIFPDELPGLPPFDSEQDIYYEWSVHFYNLMNVFYKFVIDRSCGSANVVAFPPSFLLEHYVFNSIGDGCPNLKRLVLPSNIQLEDLSMLSSVISKWKNLEELKIAGIDSLWEQIAHPYCDGEILKNFIPQISVHCKKLVSLTVVGVDFEESEASAIANLLPNLEFLSFSSMCISRDDLEMILKGCKKLVHLDVDKCLLFEVDDEILKLAAHIPTFKFGVSELYSDDDYDC